RYRFTVPTGVEGRICDRVRLSGRLVDGGDLVVQKSNTVCFSVAGLAAAPGGPAEVTTQAATPATDGTPAPLQPVESAAEAPAPAGDAPAAPAPAPPAVEISPGAAVPPTLPRPGRAVGPRARVGPLAV